jgi:predicted enzyme related to lactoylglutathione lyase
MIIGFHALVNSKDPDGVRAFFRDVLGFPHVDAGQGWLIFALPPAELGIHPTDGEPTSEIYLMCDDIEATVDELERKGAEIEKPIIDANFGRVTSLKLPGGGTIGLYQAKHPTALGLH